MKITKISVQRKEGRLNLEIDGSFFCSITTHTLADLNLYKDKEITQEQLDDLLKLELENRFYERTLNLLATRVKSKRQIQTYLRDLSLKKKDKWYSSKDIDFTPIFERVIARLERIGILNDNTFARLFVESRINGKPRGKRQIQMELQTKGISRETAKTILDELLPDNEEMIERVYAKKYKEQAFDLKDSKKVGFLLRKGFDWDDISKLERKLKDDTQE